MLNDGKCIVTIQLKEIKRTDRQQYFYIWFTTKALITIIMIKITTPMAETMPIKTIRRTRINKSR